MNLIDTGTLCVRLWDLKSISIMSSGRNRFSFNMIDRYAMFNVQLLIVHLIISEVACWSITGERQVTRIKCLYLKTILRQDIEFFDTQSATGEVIERMSGDTILLQEAMGEKVSSKSLELLLSCIVWYYHKTETHSISTMTP